MFASPTARHVAVDGVSLTIGRARDRRAARPQRLGQVDAAARDRGPRAAHGGRIALDGRDLANVPVHERGFGLMFQDYVLFPQRDVRGNVAFGLEMRGDARAAIDASASTRCSSWSA